MDRYSVQGEAMTLVARMATGSAPMPMYTAIRLPETWAMPPTMSASNSERVIVGTVLPEDGVTFYDVPQTYGATPYRYTVVNGRTVLVEPRSRRIVQIIE